MEDQCIIHTSKDNMINTTNNIRRKRIIQLYDEMDIYEQ